MNGIKGIKNIQDSFKTRQVKYGGYAVLITLAIIVGLILANLLAGQLSLQADLTSGKLFSLSEQTLQVLEQVKTPVAFYGLWKPGDERQEVMDVVNLYISRNRNIRLEVIDPDKNPGFVVKYDKEKKGISPGSLVVEGEKGFRVIGPYDMYDFTYSQQTGNRSVTGIAVERRITSALLFAGTGTTPVVYEITGHEETSLSSVRMQEMVERENYALQQINLIRVDIPKDASALVLNGPKSDLSRGEADKILAYLAGGGRFLVLADFRIRELPVLNDLLTSYGIRFDYGVVVETNRAYHPGNPYLLIPEGADHDIVKPLTEKNSPLVLPRVMGVSLLDTKRRTINAVPLLTSSGDSFLRTDLSSDSQTKIPSDMSGPITLGMAVMDPQYPENNQPQARVVAIGTGALLEPVPEFAYQQMPGNIDFFMNSLTWLEDRPETISVRSKSLFLLPMRMNELQIIIFGGLFTILIPLAFFVSGFITWLKRRHL